MKLFALAALLATGPIVHPPCARAQVEPIEPVAATMNDGFVSQYTLDTFQIASNTSRLAGQGSVVKGSVEINEATRQVRLTLDRHLGCSPGVMCITLVPAPTVVTLPIRRAERDECGALTIVAERNLLLVDGGVTRIEIQDRNGAMGCSANADDLTIAKRVKVLFSESGLRDRTAALSVMSGMPAHR